MLSAICGHCKPGSHPTFLLCFREYLPLCSVYPPEEITNRIATVLLVRFKAKIAKLFMYMSNLQKVRLYYSSHAIYICNHVGFRLFSLLSS